MKTLLDLSGDFFSHLSNTSETKHYEGKEFYCLKTALEAFLRTGLKEDAFVVYFCFSEIFKFFGNGFHNVKKLLELLADHEYHSGELLVKHRDHYSHSVYTFALGLAIYTHNATYRKMFCKMYGYDERDSYIEFLRYWGLTSLFHDIGYPFQIAHEQIKSYCQETCGNNSSHIYVSFGNLSEFISLSELDKSKLIHLLGVSSDIKNINDVFASAVYLRLGYEPQGLADKLYSRVLTQPNFMDHGYFSALLLLKHLMNTNTYIWNIQTIDVLSAILLHNNLNKYDIPNSLPISLGQHPLAYLMVLCDELQKWDRLAFGKISKREPIAYDIKLKIDAHTIFAEYIFNSATIIDTDDKIVYNKNYVEVNSGILKAMLIGGIIKEKQYKGFISSDIGLQFRAIEIPQNKKNNYNLSDSNFINLYDFAVAIHASYVDLCKESKESLNMLFGELPLEFKISNIQLAKSYAQKLALINCFYSSKELDYPLVESFEIDEYGNEDSTDLEILSRDEHVRWVREKINHGWKYGEKNVDFLSLTERNEKKLHNCIVPYELLSEEDKNKDKQAIKNIIPTLRKLGNNIKVYRSLNIGRPNIVVAGVGHRYILEDKLSLKKQVTEILKYLSKTHTVIVRTNFAYGADQIIAECANELGLITHAILPFSHDKFLEYVKKDAQKNGINYTSDDEMRLRILLAQTSLCHSVEENVDNIFEVATRCSLKNCDKLIAIWDGQKLPLYDINGSPINRGGTYDCIMKSKEMGLEEGDDIFVIKCTRK